ncbi:hypothetical protein Rhow_006766 [Rhodococcus wratislaviensis]|uniref:Uncharacterized protein n=1 Tax=Rhodococcus wratislaviensis TaxID=44752 RepID=A0A402CGF2_RHOWR|nr:hypothetical protein Rhow_006766 [Rhodococcus wratislaviensis]
MQFAPRRALPEMAERGMVGLRLRVGGNPVVPVVAAGLQWLRERLAT